MIQFYFLSIVLNCVGGYALVADGGETPSEGAATLGKLLNDEITGLLLGVLSAAVGFFKLLSVVRGDVPVVGDLIPALAGFSVGTSLLIHFYSSRSSVASPFPRLIDTVFVKNKKYVGYLGLAAGALHFLFPTVLFL